MIDEKVLELAGNLVRTWNEAHLTVPIMQLDYTWPSIGIIEKQLLNLPPRDFGGQQIDLLLGQISAYLGIITHNVASRFDETMILRPTPEQGITISTRLSPEGLDLPIEKMLKEMIFGNNGESSPENRILATGTVVAFTRGMIYGFLQLSAGKSEADSPEVPTVALPRIAQYSMDSCAEWYRRVFTKEPLGAQSELHGYELVSGCFSDCGGTQLDRGSEQLLVALQTRGLTLKEIAKVCANLAQNPLEHCSVPAIAIYAAITEELPSPQVCGAVLSQSNSCAALRRAMLKIRAALGLPGDWIQDKFSAIDIRRYQLERALGLLPAVYLPRQRIKAIAIDPQLRELVMALANSDLDCAKGILRRAQGRRDQDLELLQQEIFLDLNRGDLQSARQNLLAAGKHPLAPQSARYHHLLGLLYQREERTEQAIECLNTALKLCNYGDCLFAQIADDCAWNIFRSGNPEKSLWLSKLATRGQPCPVVPLLHRALIYWSIGLTVAQEEVIGRLLSISPFESRVIKQRLLSVYLRDLDLTQLSQMPQQQEGVTQVNTTQSQPHASVGRDSQSLRRVANNQLAV